MKPVVVPTRKAAPDKRISINQADLDWANGQGLLAGDPVKLFQALAQRAGSASSFDLAHLAWYGGAALILLAMGWFMFLVTAEYRAPALLATSVLYGAAFVGLGSHLWFRQGLKVPGGLMFTLAVSIVPLFGYSIMLLAGHTTFGNSEALVLEVATIVAAAVALTRIKFGFLTAPLYTALWLMSMTVTSIVLDNQAWLYGDHYLMVNMGLGALMMLGAFAVDRKNDEDFAFWGYFFGVLTFWISYTFLGKGGDWGNFGYFCVNLVFLLTSVVLQRYIFIVVGGLGATGYLMYEAYDVFAGSWGFPFAITLIGGAVTYLGTKYYRNREAIDNAILRYVPEGLRRS